MKVPNKTFFSVSVSKLYSSPFLKVRRTSTPVANPGIRELITIFLDEISIPFISNALKSKKAGSKSAIIFFSSSIAIVA
ncbi:hypothetical protein [Fusobacterium ulcerans]|uniref:hypothetical protein n=1 Tax=Fusobacterium ulcerans TaxID=861 RepID=UPI003FED9524